MEYIRSPYPRVWRSFEACRSNEKLNFEIRDLNEDYFDICITLMLQHFVSDEPPCKYIEAKNYPSALKELENLWRKALKNKLSLICFEVRGNKVKIVGLNVLDVECRKEKDEPFQTTDPIWAQLYGAVDAVTKSYNVYENYNVEKYLTAYGLMVLPEYRGMNIGKEILLARIPLCKELGLTVTATVFTAAASQAVAKKAGFTILSEITYEELAKMGFVFPGIQESTKSSILMGKRVE